MRELSGIVACILEAPFDNGKCSAESLEAFVKGYQHKTDGTEVLSFDHADRVSLASDYMHKNGRRAFSEILDESSDLSSAIETAANKHVCDMAVSEMKKIAGNIIQSSRSLDCPTKYKIKNVAIVVGPSFLDHFLPTYGVDNRDYYLNVEGSGNYFLQEMLVDMDGFSFPYSLEVTLEKSVG